MEVSIIITFYDGIKILETNLENLIITLKKTIIKYEILVINDNPQKEITNILKKYMKKLPLRVLNMKENGGYVKACHFGIENSSYKNIILMDSDIIPKGNWLENMFKTYQDYDMKGCVSATIVEMESNNLFSYGIGVHGVDLILFKRHGTNSLFNSIDREFSMVSSGCLLFPRKLYYELDGQDPRFMNADNDLDFTFRIKLSGYHNVMCHNAIVYHKGHISGKIRSSSFRMDSKAYLFKKWGSSLEEDTMHYLKELYSECPNITFKQVILVSLSNSLYRNDYIELFKTIHHINFVKQYDLKNPNALNHICLNEILDWDICRLNIPIIFFVDDYRILNNNYFWFANRPAKDLIFDKNGNIYQP